MSFQNYLKPAREVLKRFDIYEDLYYDEGYSISKASLKSNISLHYLLIIETFASSAVNLERLNELIAAFENEIILLDSLWIDSESQTTLILSVPLPGHADLDYFSISSSKDNSFSELLNLLQRLHSLKIAYLELSPNKLLVKNSQLFLFPFRITGNLESDYAAPEVLAGSTDFSIASDVWSLGCIFADLFISLTPLFEAVTSYERLLKMFEILGIPEWRSVEKYLTWETFKGLKMLCGNSLRETVFKTAKPVIFKMLEFDPHRRSTVQDLISKNWAEEDSKDFSKISEGPKVWLQTKEIDNYLNIELLCLKGLNLGGAQENLVVCLGYELLLNTQVHAISDNFDICPKIDLGFKQNFGINSELFKAKYRHTPIIINVYKSIKCSARKSKEVLIGSAEVFIGLLFSNSSQHRNDNSVYGWYNVMNGSYIVGQILVEINTQNPFGSTSVEALYTSEESVEAKCESIRDIKDDLTRLNTQLTRWGVDSETTSKA
jgi:serine/threonine protein kinase